MTEDQAKTIIALLKEIRDNTASSNISLESVVTTSNGILKIITEDQEEA